MQIKIFSKEGLFISQSQWRAEQRGISYRPDRLKRNCWQIAIHQHHTIRVQYLDRSSSSSGPKVIDTADFRKDQSGVFHFHIT